LNIRDFNKIIILGNGGSGKSTLGERLSKKLNIPVYHLDRLTFKTGWESVAETEFTGKLKNILSYDKWVVEGWSYNSTIPMRLQAADLIIYLEFNIWICYWYALIRHLQYSFKQNPYDPPNSNIWKKTIRMVKAMWIVHKIYEQQLRDLLHKFPETKPIVRVKNRKELKKVID
jgi:adenylate kinase family enzyme